MKRFTTYFSHYFILFLSAFFLFSACSNPADSDEEEHDEPFGIALIENGVEIATIENGELTYNDGDHLELQVGEETGLISVRFISEEGERFTPDENDGYRLQWEIENESVLEVEQHEEDGAWNFHFVGAGSGDTTIDFILFHNDHNDYQTPESFEVHVEEVVSSMEIQNEAGTTIASSDENGETNGGFAVLEGQDSEVYTAVFLDESGQEIEPDDEYELEWEIADATVADINPGAEPFTFSISGVEQGDTTVRFILVKVHEGHSDDGEHEEIEIYESSAFDIVVQ